MGVRRQSAIGSVCALAVVAQPRIAHASEFDGLAVVVLGMFVGAPAAALLAASIVASIVFLRRREVGRLARVHRWAVMIASPILGLIYPAPFIVDLRFFGIVLLWNLPVLALAFVAFGLATKIRPGRTTSR